MIRKKRKNIIIILRTLVLIGIFLFFAQWYAKSIVEDFLLRKIPSNVELKYDNLDLSIIQGNINLNKVYLKIKNKNSLEAHTFLQFEKFELIRFSYIQLLFYKTIVLDELIVEEAKMNYYPFKCNPTKKVDIKESIKLSNEILVKKLKINNSSLHVFKDAIDSIHVSIANCNLAFNNLKTDANIITQTIPVKFDTYDIKASDIFTDLGKYETLRVANINSSGTEILINDVHLYTKYSKKELTRYLTIERDHINLQIPQILLAGFDFHFNEKRLKLVADLVGLEKPRAQIYRDKLVDDDMRIKPLYSKLLRELPLTISVEQVNINDGYLLYEEKTEKERDSGKLFFEKLNAELIGITNEIDAKDTKIRATAKLIGQADLTLEWIYNVNNTADAFSASGTLLNLEVEKLNSFLEPNLRVRTKGTIDEMYYTISGNSVNSIGDMKMKYQDFKFNVLDKDRLKINKFLTVIGNIFVNDGSKTDHNGYRYGTIDVERETNKSFYNYLWLNVSDGMLSTLTGNGNKK